MKKVTIRDIAAATGTSIATVSRALQGKPGVSEELRERLKEVAARLNYVPRPTVKPGSIMMLVFPSHYLREGSHVFGRGVEVLYDRAAEAKMLVMTQTDHDAEVEACKKILKEQDVSVLIYFCGVPRDEIVEVATKQGTEVIVIHRQVDNPYISTFISDDYYGGQLVAEHFLATGRRKAIYLVPEDTKGCYSARERFAGFSDRMLQAGAEVQMVTMPKAPLEERIRYVQKQGGDFNAVFAYSDLQAREFAEGAALVGLRIPEEVSLVGYNNSNHVGVTTPELSSVYWPIDKLCHMVMDHVERYVAGRYDVFPIQVSVRPRLIIRGSSDLSLCVSKTS